jgi:TetR/AcrR family transcriptional regulator, cholesterol catabolism regulator
MAKIVTGKNNTKKEVILKKAATLFKTKSFSASSMRELAEVVGVEAPSLYNHIGSKSELLQDICFRIGGQFTLQIEHISASNKKTVEKIEAVIRFHIELMAENFDEVYVANHEWKHLNEPYLSDFLNIRRNYEKSLMGFIEEGIAKNEIKAVNPYVTVLTILSAVRGLEFWQRNKKNVPLQVLENDMVNQLLYGIVQ